MTKQEFLNDTKFYSSLAKKVFFENESFINQLTNPFGGAVITALWDEYKCFRYLQENHIYSYSEAIEKGYKTIVEIARYYLNVELNLMLFVYKNWNL